MSTKSQSTISRRGFIRAAGLTSAGLALLPQAPSSKASGLNLFVLPDSVAPPTPDEALRLLVEGNARYVQCEALGLNRGPRRREEQYSHQTPFAAVLDCIDSRVPPEIFFDRGVGDMFVPRAAGQTLDSAVIGSIEFAVSDPYNVPLIMVLGHEECGAVKGAIKYVDNPKDPPPGDILYIVKQIAPAVPRRGNANRLERAITNNVKRVIDELKERDIIAKAIAAGRLKIVGAECSLKSGKVKIY
ncbi:MAG: carbonic anhydrase [Blastocatellia bacterium]